MSKDLKQLLDKIVKAEELNETKVLAELYNELSQYAKYKSNTVNFKKV